MVIGWLALSQPAIAQETELTLTLTPSSIIVLPNRPRSVVLTVNNPTDTLMSGVQLTVPQIPGVQITRLPTDTLPLPLPAHAQRAWILTLLATDAAPLAEIGQLRIDYQLTTADGSLVPHVAFATLTVSSPAIEPIARIAQVHIIGADRALNDGEHTTIYALIQNTSSYILTIDSVELRGPSFLHTESKLSTKNTPIIAPQSSTTVELTLTADDAVVAGEYTLAIPVQLHWFAEGQLHSATISTEYVLKMGVYGESAILTALGVPAFFLLPGFLFVAAIGWGLRFRRSATAVDEWRNQLGTVDFWLLAITVSLIATLVYTGVTHRDYIRSGYGLLDIYYLWFGSLMFGLILAGFVRAAELVRQNWQERQNFAASDTPMMILKKLVRRKDAEGFQRRRVTSNGTLLGLLLQEQDSQKCWLIPYILLDSERRLAEVSSKQGITDFEQLRQLVTQFEQGQVPLRWKPIGNLQSPHLVERGGLKIESDRIMLFDTE